MNSWLGCKGENSATGWAMRMLHELLCIVAQLQHTLRQPAAKGRAGCLGFMNPKHLEELV
jgi:hypothetical protein